jgi:hypothetical protein
MPFGIGEHWVKAEGLVAASREIGSKNLGTWRTEWVIEVHPTEGGVFRSAIKEPMVEHDDFRFKPVSDAEKARLDEAFNDALAGRTPPPTNRP